MGRRGSVRRAAARLLAAELRRPQPLLVATWLALAAGIAALAAVDSLGTRLERTLVARGAGLLGGDVKVSARRDLRPDAARLPPALRPHAVVVELPTMVGAGERLTLAELKAVDAAWPLLGRLEVQPAATGALPARGSVYVDPGLLAKLDLAVGERLEIGRASFTVAGLIVREPDRLADAFSLGPRVLLAAADLPATGLIQPLSRVRTGLLYRAPPGGADALAARLRAALPRDVSTVTAREGLAATRGLLGETADFLRLVAAAGLLVAVAAASALDGLLADRAPAVAVLKALGAPRRTVLCAWGGVLAVLALAAGAGGALAGVGLAGLAVHLLGDVLPPDLPAAGLHPLLGALAAALVLTAAIGGPALLRLRAFPPLAALRAPAPGERGLAGAATGLLLALAAGGLLLAVRAAQPALSLALYAGLVALAGVLVALAWGLARVLAATARGPLAWRYAAGALARAPGQTTLAVAALALAVLAALTPALVGSGLVAQWGARVPADAPNRFLIDIQPDQRAGAERILRAHGATGVWLRPIVRARLATRNGRPITDTRRSGSGEREQNLTWTAAPEPGNRIIAGRWWQGRPAVPEVSVEAGYAERLGITLGDRLGFEIAGAPFEARVTSLREVAWESLRSNFFLVFAPGALEDEPATWVTSFHVDPARGPALERALVAAYTNLTVLDLGAIRATLEDLLTRLGQGTATLAAAAMVAGAAVLLAGVLAQRTRLRRELTLLRCIGAPQGWLRAMLALRFALPGALAGLLGALAAWALGATVSAVWLGFALRPAPWSFVLAPLAGAVAAATVGAFGARGVLRSAPVAILRSS